MSAPYSNSFLLVLGVLVALTPFLCHAFVGILFESRIFPTRLQRKDSHSVVFTTPLFDQRRPTDAETKVKDSGDSGTTLPPSTKKKKRKKIPSFDYDWKDQWYALTYADYVPNPSQSAETIPASVFGHPLVLWRSQDNSIIHCADDVCPHRRAALSEGRVRNGQLECYYHGWQFQGTANATAHTKAGDCTFIPQLSTTGTGTTGATIPQAACLTMRDCRIVEGIVWVWMGDDLPTKDVPKQGDGLDPLTGVRDGFFMNNFQIDLPYDHSYLVENLLDPAHIPIRYDQQQR